MVVRSESGAGQGAEGAQPSRGAGGISLLAGAAVHEEGLACGSSVRVPEGAKA